MGPFGAKGVGEPPITPTLATMANAVADAVGIRITELPMKPGKGCRGIARQREVTALAH